MKLRMIANMEPLTYLPHRKRGRPLLLGKKIDKMVSEKFMKQGEMYLAN